jgi:hypothetical protein
MQQSVGQQQPVKNPLSTLSTPACPPKARDGAVNTSHSSEAHLGSHVVQHKCARALQLATLERHGPYPPPAGHIRENSNIKRLSNSHGYAQPLFLPLRSGCQTSLSNSSAQMSSNGPTQLRVKGSHPMLAHNLASKRPSIEPQTSSTHLGTWSNTTNGCCRNEGAATAGKTTQPHMWNAPQTLAPRLPVHGSRSCVPQPGIHGTSMGTTAKSPCWAASATSVSTSSSQPPRHSSISSANSAISCQIQPRTSSSSCTWPYVTVNPNKGPRVGGSMAHGSTTAVLQPRAAGGLCTLSQRFQDGGAPLHVPKPEEASCKRPQNSPPTFLHCATHDTGLHLDPGRLLCRMASKPLQMPLRCTQSLEFMATRQWQATETSTPWRPARQPAREQLRSSISEHASHPETLLHPCEISTERMCEQVDCGQRSLRSMEVTGLQPPLKNPTVWTRVSGLSAHSRALPPVPEPASNLAMLKRSCKRPSAAVSRGTSAHSGPETSQGFRSGECTQFHNALFTTPGPQHPMTTCKDVLGASGQDYSRCMTPGCMLTTPAQQRQVHPSFGHHLVYSVEPKSVPLLNQPYQRCQNLAHTPLVPQQAVKPQPVVPGHHQQQQQGWQYAKLPATLCPYPCCPGVFTHCAAELVRQSYSTGSSERWVCRLCDFACFGVQQIDKALVALEILPPGVKLHNFEGTSDKNSTEQRALLCMKEPVLLVKPLAKSVVAVLRAGGIAALLSRVANVKLDGALAISAEAVALPMATYEEVKGRLQMANLAEHHTSFVPDWVMDSYRGRVPQATEAEVESALGRMPSSLRKSLMPFQVEGVRFGLRHFSRCLIGDEMGVSALLLRPVCALGWGQKIPSADPWHRLSDVSFWLPVLPRDC